MEIDGERHTNWLNDCYTESIVNVWLIEFSTKSRNVTNFGFAAVIDIRRSHTCILLGPFQYGDYILCAGAVCIVIDVTFSVDFNFISK